MTKKYWNLGWAVSLTAAMGSTGCSNLFNQHAQMMDAMRGVMSDTAARLSESGSGQIAAGGQVINPGLRVAGGVEYYAVAQYEGVSGQVTASMQGRLDRPFAKEVQRRIDAIWRDAGLTAEQRLQLIHELLRQWNEEDRHGPNSPQQQP